VQLCHFFDVDNTISEKDLQEMNIKINKSHGSFSEKITFRNTENFEKKLDIPVNRKYIDI
jgi:hypothetical protein